jgi:transposase-like protein
MAKSTDTIEDTTFETVALDDPDFLRHLVERALQRFLEAEMTAHLGAARYERSDYRRGHRNGYKPRQLHTRVGTLTLRVPQDREGTFSTQLFARYQRSEKALVLALMEMYVEGVSTRKVAEVTEALCGQPSRRASSPSSRARSMRTWRRGGSARSARAATPTSSSTPATSTSAWTGRW